MSVKRLIPPPHYTKSHYHCFNRVAGGIYLFNDEEKDEFNKYLREYETFCGVTVVTQEPMTNHFHIELEVPLAPEVMPTDEELFKLLEALTTKQAFRDRKALQKFIKNGEEELAHTLRKRLFARMWNLSQFMKLLQERFTQWFNKKHGRQGTLWEGPFGCEMVEGRGKALVHQAVYIDLNASRAGIVGDPADYRWGGFAQATAGDPKAIRGLRIVVGAHMGADPKDLTDEEVLKTYRLLLDMAGEVKGTFSREKCIELFEAGEDLPLDQFLRCRVRYMTSGLAMGSREFVEEVFQANRGKFGKTRKTGARRMRGVQGVELYTLRDLRKKVLS